MQKGVEPPLADATAVEDPAGDHAAVAQKSSPLFDIDRLQTCVDHANAVTATYGVSIISINIVAAVPSDRTLQSSLAQGAVAAAEAQKFETVARGRASAALIRAGQESEIPNFKASYLGRFPLVSADFWTSDHLSERSRSVGAFSGTRARGTLTLKQR